MDRLWDGTVKDMDLVLPGREQVEFGHNKQENEETWQKIRKKLELCAMDLEEN